MDKNNLVNKILSITLDNERIVITIFCLKIKFKDKNFYVFYNRYIKRLLRFVKMHSYIPKRNFFVYLFKYNHITINILEQFISIREFINYYLGLKLNIHSMDMNLTTRCTLRCKECGSLMPFYTSEKQWTIDFETFKKDLNKLLKCVNNIYRFKLIGGEPLLVKDLDKMLEYAASKRKIKTIEIVTNGTLAFSEKLISVMCKHKNKLLVSISDYSSNPDLILKHCELENILKTNCIKYQFISPFWYERGNIKKKNRDIKELKRVFSKCWQKELLCLFDGKFYNCTRAATIERLTNYRCSDGQMIDLRNNAVKIIKNQYKLLFTKEYFNTCDFCEEVNDKKILPAEQTNEILQISQIYSNETDEASQTGMTVKRK